MKILKIVAIILLSLVILGLLYPGFMIIMKYSIIHRLETVSPFADSQDGTTWISEDQTITFQMDKGCGYGIVLINGEDVPIEMRHADPGASLDIGFRGEGVSIFGTCSFRNNAFTFEIESSNHPEYAVGDKIVFTKVE